MSVYGAKRKQIFETQRSQQTAGIVGGNVCIAFE
jgi:hypothetical protein